MQWSKAALRFRQAFLGQRAEPAFRRKYIISWPTAPKSGSFQQCVAAWGWTWKVLDVLQEIIACSLAPGLHTTRLSGTVSAWVFIYGSPFDDDGVNRSASERRP